MIFLTGGSSCLVWSPRSRAYDRGLVLAVGEGKEDTEGSAVGAGASWAPGAPSSWEPHGHPGLRLAGSSIRLGASWAPGALSSWELCGTGSLASLQLSEGCSLVGEGHCSWARGAGSAPWQEGWPHQQQRPSSLTGVCNEQPHPDGVSGPGWGWGPNLPRSLRPLCSLL